VKAPEVRVLAGRWKGRRLEAGPATRPTSSRARAALFDILGQRIQNAAVLDLYAGSGAVGIEAVSRGARSATLVEQDAAGLTRSIARLGAEPGELLVVAGTVAAALGALAARGECFDLIFADPPYGATEPVFPGGSEALLSSAGVLVLQEDARTTAPTLEPLALLSERRYGRNVFFFFGMR
jgi:16S rRNA (guanine966-N2)-methyltransferase